MKKKIKIMLVLVALILSCFLSCFSNNNLVVYASNIGLVGGYTNVLTDLSQDKTFNAEDYIVNETDYSLQLITIAESNEKELFVYVYQPSAEHGNLKANKISISQDFHTKSFKIYDLMLINNQGTLYKYMVKNFVVSNNSVRYYEISELFREFNADYDASVDNNIIVNMPFAVGKQFTFDNSNALKVEDVEYITITSKYVGFVRYDGASMPIFINEYEHLDSHFIAFSSDKKIENLLEADIYFKTQTEEYRATSGDTILGEEIEQYKYLNFNDKFEYESGKWYYERQRIQTIDDFLTIEHEQNIYDNGFINFGQDNALSETTMQNLKSKQWVLRFFESEFTQSLNVNVGEYSYSQTNVTSVAILRLKFETDNVTYDLGVVDTMQSGNGSPDNIQTYTYSLSDTFKIILVLLLLLILCVVFAPILPVVFSVVGVIIKLVFKILIAILSAPFKLIKWVTNKGKK